MLKRADVTVVELRAGCVATHVGHFVKGFNGNPDVEQYKSSIFIKRVPKKGKGREIWSNSGVFTENFSRLEDAVAAGRALAASYEISYIEEVGSLHNKKVPPPVPVQTHRRVIRLRNNR